LILLRDCLSRTDLSDRARSSLLFALGKAHDDIGEYGQAAHHFRQANALAHALTLWSRKDWRRAVEARLASAPFVHHAESRSDFIPVFIVGMPRSGTTLLAERLSRYPGVCNRGELPWIARLAQRADLTGAVSPEALKRAADVYMAQAQRDDSAGKRWFLDKQPLNFRYVDLMLALFPNAKIIHCTRNLRDTAMSLWMQSFGEDVQGYAYDFDDIAVVMRDCARMMARWRGRHPEAIRMLRYEDLVAQPDAAVAGLADWLGATGPGAGGEKSSSISTASLWQARQPVYSSSLQRWRRYAEYVPELSRFADEA